MWMGERQDFVGPMTLPEQHASNHTVAGICGSTIRQIGDDTLAFVRDPHDVTIAREVGELPRKRQPPAF